jgi:hypothetical protein
MLMTVNEPEMIINTVDLLAKERMMPMAEIIKMVRTIQTGTYSKKVYFTDVRTVNSNVF